MQPGQGQLYPSRLLGHQRVARYRTGYQITGSVLVLGWPMAAHAGEDPAMNPDLASLGTVSNSPLTRGPLLGGLVHLGRGGEQKLGLGICVPTCFRVM